MENSGIYQIYFLPGNSSGGSEWLDYGFYTWDTYHMIPTERPSVNPPSVKTNTVDIPGSYGVLDLTESLTGYPVFSNRTGSWEFAIDPKYLTSTNTWDMIYTDILNRVHGRQMRVFMYQEGFNKWYYEGRIAVNQWKSNKSYSTITFDYDLGPFKWSSRTSTDEDWLWDPFDFENDYIYEGQFSGITVDGSYTWLVPNGGNDITGYAPISPTITVHSSGGEGMEYAYYVNYGVYQGGGHLKDGENTVPYFYWTPFQVFPRLVITGNGTIDITFRKGSL